MSDVMLKVESRDLKGKSKARKLRYTGMIPAVVYGEGHDTTSVTLNTHAFELFLKGNHSVVELDINGKKERAIVREIQRHPVTGNVLHVDFMLLKTGQKINLYVNLHFMGKSAGVKEGGIFQTIKSEVHISVLPKDIPDFIEVDISGLNLGDSLRIKDIVAENVEFLEDPEDVICGVQAPKMVEEEEAEELEEEEELAEPEVITAREQEEESESGAE